MNQHLTAGKIFFNLMLGALCLSWFGFITYFLLYGTVPNSILLWSFGIIFGILTIHFFSMGSLYRLYVGPSVSTFFHKLSTYIIKTRGYLFYEKYLKKNFKFLFGIFMLFISLILVGLAPQGTLIAIYVFYLGAKIIKNNTDSQIGQIISSIVMYPVHLLLGILRTIFTSEITKKLFRLALWLVGIGALILLFVGAGIFVASLSATTIIIILLILIWLK